MAIATLKHPLAGQSPLKVHPDAQKLGLPQYRPHPGESQRERSARFLKHGMNDYGHPLSAGDRAYHKRIVTGPRGGVYEVSKTGKKHSLSHAKNTAGHGGLRHR